MILIVEGTVGVGKTTAALAVAAERRAWYRAGGDPRELLWQTEYVVPLGGLRGDAVLDRWHLAGIVEPELREAELVSPFATLEDLRRCCRVLATLGAQLVVIERDLDAVMDVVIDRGGNQAAQVRAMRAQRRYLELAEQVSGWMPTRVLASDAIHAGEVDLWP